MEQRQVDSLSPTVKDAIMKKIDRIKQHLRDNKKTYIVGGLAFLGGATAVVATSRSIHVATPIQALTYKSTQVNEIYQLPQVSNLAKPVIDTTTGTPYLSQKRAANALGISPSMVSQHMAGKTSDVKGHVLEYIPAGS